MSAPISFPKAALKAVARFAPDNDTRQYINVVHVEAAPTKVRLTATDGASMASYQYEPRGAEWSALAAFSIPIAIVRKAVTWKGAQLFVEINEGKYRIFANASESAEFNAPVDTTPSFPDYRRVIPRETSGELGQFQPQHLMACANAQKDLRKIRYNNCSTQRVHHNGRGAAIVDIGVPEFVAIVMPVQDELPVEGINHHWIYCGVVESRKDASCS